MEKTYFKNIVGEIHSHIDKLIEDGILQNKKIILFGLNTSSYVMEDYLRDKNIEITAYIDNDKTKRERFKRTVPSYSPEQMAETYGNDVVILIISKYYKEMKKQLEQLGYQEKQHIIQIVDMNDMEQYVDYSDVSGMKEASLEQLKDIQIILLKELKKICEKHGLRYYLCGGTLIGALRHKGYIPWDDDIDVIMPMKDYKQLLRVVNDSEIPYKILNVYDYPDTFASFFGKMTYPDTVIKSWTYPYIDSMPINIDIFPLYGLPEKNEEGFADRMEELHVEIVEEYIKYPQLTQHYFALQREILTQMEKYNFDESENVAFLFSRYKKKEITPRSIYDKTIMAEFEGELYPIAEGCDIYLTNLYGADYMELPPEEKRVSVHNCRAFIKEA